MARFFSFLRNAPDAPASEASFIISFPRSGSNYLQSIIEKRLGLSTASLYSEGIRHSPIQNLKSHAMSPEYFYDELEFIANGKYSSSKFVFLHRDPRDALISFFNYFHTKSNSTVSQNDFLEVDWFFALQEAARTWKRTCHLEPASIGDAFRTMISSWLEFEKSSSSDNFLRLSYETVVHDECAATKTLSGFLNTKSVSLSEKIGLVSQYSEERRPRGQAYGWTNSSTYEAYAQLIEATNSLLGDEIQLLGYDITP